MKKRLADARTLAETGLTYVISGVNTSTPFGEARIKGQTPFFPGEERLLREEFKKLETILLFVTQNREKTTELTGTLAEIKDIKFTISRCAKDTLSTVELFEIKSLLLKMSGISEIISRSTIKIPPSFVLLNMEQLLSTLDPRNDRMDTFYIYDEFSEELAESRKKKRAIEGEIRKLKKHLSCLIKEKYGITLTPKHEYMMSKAQAEQIKVVREIPELIQNEEDYLSVTFTIKNDAEIEKLLVETDDILLIIERLELGVRERLSLEIAGYEKDLLENCDRIGELDAALSKVIYAINHNCVSPEISDEYVIEIEAGRHSRVEDTLISKNKVYCPVNLSLKTGVTCITGANMGGKTVSLKLAGLVSLLAQYGYFVPCSKAVIGLSNYIRILVGDNQSLERGLSSFGGEMETLREILAGGEERSLLLIDEIASGTNPAEGFALTKSLAGYLSRKPYITLLTTHFDNVATGADVVNIQVVGLAGADLKKLEKELKYANARERLDIIAKYMDYGLERRSCGKWAPKDALNIAKMLGIQDEIIEPARKYLEEKGDHRE